MKYGIKKRLKRAVLRRFVARAQEPDFIAYGGVRLPPQSIRFCTTDWKNDDFFIRSAAQEVKRLQELAGLDGQSRILDIGSGQGRLAIGIQKMIPEIKAYFGVDVNLDSVEWCKRNIAALHPNFHFIHTDFANDRYNPSGVAFNHPVQLPLKDRFFDVIFLYSVFTHMTSADIRSYLGEIRRLLAKDGKAVFSVYVEDDCADECENPTDYLTEFGGNRGRLHRVRFQKEYFDRLIERAGLRVDRFSHRCEKTTKQSIYVVTGAQGEAASVSENYLPTPDVEQAA